MYGELPTSEEALHMVGRVVAMFLLKAAATVLETLVTSDAGETALDPVLHCAAFCHTATTTK